MTEAAPKKSDAVRFRLTLALLLSVCAIVVAMFVVEWWPLSKRRQLASEIEKAGGRISYREDQQEQTKQVGVIRKLLQLSLGFEYFAEVDAVSLTPRSVVDAQKILAVPNLRSLQLRGQTVTDEFLLKLNGLKELNELSLENVKLDDAKEALQQHPRLVALRLTQCSLSTPFLNAIRGIKDLSTLTIEQCTVDQDGWEALHGAQSNLDLNISEQALSEVDIVALHAANPGWRIHFATPKASSDTVMGVRNVLPSVNELPKTTYLKLHGPNVTDATLAAIKSASELTGLELVGCQITDNGMQLLQQFPKLTSLSIYDIPISDNGIRVVQYLPNLAHLSILDAPITDQGVQHFAALAKLEFLQLERTRIAGTTLGELSPTVKNLGLHTSEVTDPGVASISQLSALESLSLGSQRITDACIKDLAKMKSLKLVEFYQSPLSATALDRLKAAIPGCTVNAY